MDRVELNRPPFVPMAIAMVLVTLIPGSVVLWLTHTDLWAWILLAVVSLLTVPTLWFAYQH